MDRKGACIRNWYWVGIGTATGAFLSVMVLGSVVGPEIWKLAGQFTGTYYYGVNLAALGRAFDTSSKLFSAAITADVLVTALWMMACLATSVLFARRRVAAELSTEPVDDEDHFELAQALYKSRTPITMEGFSKLVVVDAGAVWCARQLGDLVTLIPRIRWLSTIAFSVALHGIYIFNLGRILRLDPATLAVASQANVGGPSSAMALATAHGSTHLVLPGIAVGALGYAGCNYSGFAGGTLARGVLG